MADYGAALSHYQSKNANANAARKAPAARRGYVNHVIDILKQIEGGIAADRTGAKVEQRLARADSGGGLAPGPENGWQAGCYADLSGNTRCADPNGDGGLYTMGRPPPGGWAQLDLGGLGLNLALFVATPFLQEIPGVDAAVDAVDIARLTSGAADATEVATEDVAGASAANPLGAVDNCVSCAIAGDSTLGGARARAIACGPQPISAIEDALGGSFQSVSGRAEIEQILNDAGAGARGIVYGSRGAGAIGHVFNAALQDGSVNFIDFQAGGEASFAGYSSFQFLLSAGGG